MALSKVGSIASQLLLDIIEDTLFVARETNLMSGLVTNYRGQGWMNRRIGVYPTLTATTIDEDQDFVNPTEWTKTLETTLTPQEIMTQVEITDRRLETDPEDARRDAAREMGGAIATKVDKDLLDLFNQLTAGTIGAEASALTITRCAAALSILRATNVGNPLYVVLHPYALARAA